MKKFNKIKTTGKQDKIILSLCSLLYPEFNFYLLDNDLVYIYEKESNTPKEVIHWYELMTRNILVDFLSKSLKILYNYDAKYSFGDPYDYSMCSQITHIEGIIYNEDEDPWRKGNIDKTFKFLEKAIIKIKEYEQIIASGRTDGQNSNNG